MRDIKVLDTTLRDGGYANHFQFGAESIRRIINGLEDSNIDIIEIGFLKNVVFNNNLTLYDSMERIQDIVYKKKEHVQYVLMIRLGDFPEEKLRCCSNSIIDGIRLAFHEHEIDASLDYAKSIIDSGYKLFLQPVSTFSYSNSSIKRLIDGANRLSPYAFYIVDTLGCLSADDVSCCFSVLDSSLQSQIKIGLHSHDNLGLSFRNACEFCRISSNRDIIIDSSILGMGRGAGNLDTKTIVQFLNDYCEKKYNLGEFSNTLERWVFPFKKEYTWGRNHIYEISAQLKCHPNYASYLVLHGTTDVFAIESILKELEPNRRVLYDENYISEIYRRFVNDIVVGEQL